MTGRARFDDSGETLLEVLVAVAVMSIAAVGIIGTIVTSILLSSTHRSATNSSVAVHTYAEAIEKYVGVAGNYVDCATTSSYTPAAVGYVAPANVTVLAYSIQYWTGSAWGSCTSPDSGVQRLTLSIRSSDTRASESISVVIRKPCAVGSSCS